MRLEHPSLGLTWFSLVSLGDSLGGDLKNGENKSTRPLCIFSMNFSFGSGKNIDHVVKGRE